MNKYMLCVLTSFCFSGVSFGMEREEKKPLIEKIKEINNLSQSGANKKNNDSSTQSKALNKKILQLISYNSMSE